MGTLLVERKVYLNSFLELSQLFCIILCGKPHPFGTKIDSKSDLKKNLTHLFKDTMKYEEIPK